MVNSIGLEQTLPSCMKRCALTCPNRTSNADRSQQFGQQDLGVFDFPVTTLSARSSNAVPAVGDGSRLIVRVRSRGKD